MARAGSLEAGQELHGLVKPRNAGQTRQLFSDLWEKQDRCKYASSLLNVSSPWGPFRSEVGRCIVNALKGKSDMSWTIAERPVQERA